MSVDPDSDVYYYQDMFAKHQKIADKFAKNERVVVHLGDCLELLAGIPSESLKLVVTSPPYNIGKEYEKRLDLETYLAQQEKVITECYRALSPTGSLCWQVGNYVAGSSIIPLDTILYPVFTKLGLKMRNRIIWHFEHGLLVVPNKRFSAESEPLFGLQRPKNTLSIWTLFVFRKNIRQKAL